jgi:ArsR family transcriptional regulator, lead/cadmium/zinc/bismuth-responsive transcriptional repressor
MNVRSDVGALRIPAKTGNPAIEAAADVFGLLADPGRLRLLDELRAAERNVSDLAARCLMSESATSHALRVLRAQRIVEARREGRLAYYRLADDHVRQLLEMAFEHAEHTSPIREPGDSA